MRRNCTRQKFEYILNMDQCFDKTLIRGTSDNGISFSSGAFNESVDSDVL